MDALRTPLWALVLLAIGSGCGQNILLDPESRAAALPRSADVAVGATHDVLVIACQDHVTISDFVFPVAATTLFVGLGRLDAAFYLPGALVNAAIPQCEPVEYSVNGASMEGASFELETTGNDRAFKAHARGEGAGTFKATARVDGEDIPVETTLTAWKADRVEFAPACSSHLQNNPNVLKGHVPAGGNAEFRHQLFSGTRKLTGYGYFGVSHPRMTLKQDRAGSVGVALSAEKGPFTVTSDIDAAFKLELTSYDAADFDAVTLTHETAGHLFVGEKTKVTASATIGGKHPCVDTLRRTLTISTPSVCTLISGGAFEEVLGATRLFSWNGPSEVKLLAPGTCRISLALEGSALTSSVDITVFRGFASTPLLADQYAGQLHDLWGTAPDNYVAVGAKLGNTGWEHAITLRKTGTTIDSSNQPFGPKHLAAVHGTSTSNVFAVGNDGIGANWNGNQWTRFDAGVHRDLTDVWVNSASDVYAVGESGAFAHFDGASWTRLDAGTTRNLTGVWSDGAGALYVVGHAGFVKRWDGSAFVDVLPPALQDAGFHPSGISGSGPADVWVGAGRDALHFDGANWRWRSLAPPDAGATVYRNFTFVAGGYVYALTQRNQKPYVARFDGTRTVFIPLFNGATSLIAWGNDVYVLGPQSLNHYRHDPADVFP